MPNITTFAPQTVTLTNTGGIALTWTANNNSIYVNVSPATGTLAPNAHVDLAVLGHGGPFFGIPYTYQPPDVTITSDVPGDLVHTLSVTNASNGYFVTPPPTVAFGPVPVGTTVSKTVPQSWFVTSPYLFVTQQTDGLTEFALNGFASITSEWTLYFTPPSAGAKSATLVIADMPGCVFPPNTFLATGTGI